MEKNLPKYAKSILKPRIIESAAPSADFNGIDEFSPTGWDSNKHNTLNHALPSSRCLEDICETKDGTYLIISSTSVVEIAERGFIIHPATTAPWWIAKVTVVHTVSVKARASMLIFSIDAWSR